MTLFIDGVIILAYFAIILAIGLRMGRRDKNLEDFALGGRHIPWWAVMASVIAAETSAATFLGAPAEGFDKRSLAYVQLVFGLILGRYVVGRFFLKPYFDYKVFTVYDYLGVRFGPRTKQFVSALFLIMRTLASGTRLFVPSLVMVLAWRLFTTGQADFGNHAVNSTMPYFIAIATLTVITCIYTAIGGIKAVIWTDVIQACLMFGGAIIALITLWIHVGGWPEVVRAVPDMTAAKGYFLTGFEPARIASWVTEHHLSAMNVWEYIKLILASDYTLLSALIGAALTNMAAFGTDQDMVQRLLTAETHQKARRSLMTAALMDLPIAAIFTFIGILLFTYYQQNPSLKPAATSDVFGAYILNGLPVVIRGLVIAGVFATAMGSFSAALNALATSAVNDWIVPRMGPNPSDTAIVKFARISTVVFAVLMVVVATAFAYAKVHNPKLTILPVVLGIAGLILGPMLGVFLLGMFTKRGSDRGNIIALIAGLTATLFVSDVYLTIANAVLPYFHVSHVFTHPEWMPKVSFTWYAAVGSMVVLAVGTVFRERDKPE